jgi:hypothetical protein
MYLATFCVDVTPPVGHPLCAGWIPSALGIADPLYCKGVILSDGKLPVVLCAVDWCEISNRSHLLWRSRLSEAVGTILSRVMVHCVHAHCAPWPDECAQQLMETQSGVLPVMDSAWCAEALERVVIAAREAITRLTSLTHMTSGRAEVKQVASNRRIINSDGRSKAVRWIRTHDPAVRAEPEGLIDPWLKTISFWNQNQKLATLHYYAVHPSSYEDSFVTPDFAGLARERRQSEDDGIPHLYFTECAGNITPGKYNDGAIENREKFTCRIYQAMHESEKACVQVPAEKFQLKSVAIKLSPRQDYSKEKLDSLLHDKTLTSKERCRAALMLAYRERQSTPIDITALHFGDAFSLLHLPGEAFVEYQIFAQEQRPNSFVVVPAYGDCGPGYLCLERSFDEGGYEPYDSFVAPESESVLKSAITQLMQPS